MDRFRTYFWISLFWFSNCGVLYAAACAVLSTYFKMHVGMAIDVFKTLDIIEVMENYLETVRPPEEMRKQVDLSYKIENQSVILTEVRPVWNRPGEYAEYEYAKANFIKSKNSWKICWMRRNLKWRSYDPLPEVATLQEFLRAVDEDQYHCFKG